MRDEKFPAVYIMANRDGFTKVYGLKMLVWYEHHHTMEDAINREKQLKKWNREWKIKLIEKSNPFLKDLANYLF